MSNDLTSAWRKVLVGWFVAALLAFPVAPILLELCVGWASHLARFTDRVRWDRGEIALGLTCLVLLIAAAHTSACGLCSMFKAYSWPLGRTFRSLGLVFALSTVAIALLGLVHQSLWIVRAPVPMVRGVNVFNLSAKGESHVP
jgi:hypothetical protein